MEPLVRLFLIQSISSENPTFFFSRISLSLSHGWANAIKKFKTTNELEYSIGFYFCLLLGDDYQKIVKNEILLESTLTLLTFTLAVISSPILALLFTV